VSVIPEPRPPRSWFPRSPRRRRRLLQIGITLVVLAAVASPFVLLESKGGEPRWSIGGAATAVDDSDDLGSGDVESERVRVEAESATWPLAQRFVEDVTHHGNLARAYGLLAPTLQSRYQLADWKAGRNLLLPLAPKTTYRGGTTAFSGANTVGLVLSFNEPGYGRDQLYALRFAKQDSGKWRVDYAHHGQSTYFVGEREYAPHGFLPGDANTTLWWWLTIPLGLGLLILLAALIDRRLQPQPPPSW
jgi:hypothetical protein